MTVPEEFLVEPSGVLASRSLFAGEAAADVRNTMWQVSLTVLRAASPLMPGSPSQPDHRTTVVPHPEPTFFGPQSLATRSGNLWSAATLERHIATLAAARRPLPPPRALSEAAPDLANPMARQPPDGDHPQRRGEATAAESHEDLDWSDLDLLADILNDLAPETRLPRWLTHGDSGGDFY